MERECSGGKVGIDMRADISMTSGLAMERCSGVTALCTRATGREASRMGREG